MRTKTRWISALAAVGLLALGAAPAAADHIRGIRVTPTDINPGTMIATVDVTMFTTENSSNSFDVVSWGDGGTATGLALPYVSETIPTSVSGGDTTLYVKRASFMHSYPDLMTRTITVQNRSCCPPTAGLIYTGNSTSGNPSASSGYLTNTAVINFAAAPSLPSYGLLLLAVVLSALGVLLLRRSPNVAI